MLTYCNDDKHNNNTNNIYIHTYIHACMHAYIHTCIHAYISFLLVVFVDSSSLPLAWLPGVCSGGGQGDPPDILNGLTCNPLSLTW